jgi:hypothetical protein
VKLLPFCPISVAKAKPLGPKWKLSFDWTTFDVQATAQYRQSLKLQYWNVIIKQRFKLMVLLSMVHIIEYHFHLSDSQNDYLSSTSQGKSST